MAPKRTPTIDRFNRFTVQPQEGCWLWQGHVRIGSPGRGGGYALLWVGDHKVYAHRWSYEHFKGPIPVGYDIDHLCRVRHCVNPDHLEAIPHVENLRRGNTGKHLRDKTHCPKGHPYSGDNLYIIPSSGGRVCRQCGRDRYHPQ